MFLLQHQGQSQSQNQSLNINFLKKELENELKKDYPNESKIKKTINDIIDVAKSSASGIITAIFLKILGT